MGISIAVTGKGGTGKTVLATLIIRILAKERGLRVLAIDADSASSLPYTLGIEVTKTISQLRQESAAYNRDRKELDRVPIIELMKGLVTHGDGFDLLAMGRPEEPGCFCAVNELLRYGIDALADEYDIVVIDGEAGPEQLNRRVLTDIDFLFILADMSFRSFQTAKAIQGIATQADGGISVAHSGIVLNRVRKESEKETFLKDLEVIGFIPEDPTLNDFDREGKSLFSLPDNAVVLQAVRQVLRTAMSR